MYGNYIEKVFCLLDGYGRWLRVETADGNVTELNLEHYPELLAPEFSNDNLQEVLDEVWNG